MTCPWCDGELQPPWNEGDRYRCKGCRRWIDPAEVVGAHVHVLSPIDIPLGPKLEVIQGGEA